VLKFVKRLGNGADTGTATRLQKLKIRTIGLCIFDLT